MFPQDPYTLKALEYLLGLVFLILFVGFWQYATGGRTAAAAKARGHAAGPNRRRRRDVHWQRRQWPRIVHDAHSIS